MLRSLALTHLLLILLSSSTHADSGSSLRLPKVFGDHMVLQRDLPLAVWGWAREGERVTVGIADAQVQATANAAGEWKVTLPAMPAGGPYTMTVQASETFTFVDVLVGEVWLCVGQSNMEMGIGACRDGPSEIAAADHPRLRLLMVPNRFTALPERDMEGVWKVCTPKTVADGGWGGFSAAAYYFGRTLQQTLDVPVGLIDASWGGTVIQTWTPPEGFAMVPALQDEYERVQLADPRSALHRKRLAAVIEATERWAKEARRAMETGAPAPPQPPFPPELLPLDQVQRPTALYNGMVHPLLPFALRGAIWYQGESNLSDGALYKERMKALVGGWRSLWGLGDFPFYYVQIAPYRYGGNPHAAPLFWEAQEAALAIPNTGMIVINDIGNVADIHPANKQEVGRRLALWALVKTYGKKVLHRGPTVQSVSIEGKRMRVTFEHVGSGLQSRDGKPLTWFEIIDAEEGGFVEASARMEGASVLLTAPEVNRPAAVRFAWNTLAEPNLVNSEGLPAGAFRAGSVPDRDLLAIHVREAKGFTLVYDLDLTKLGANLVYETDASAKITRPFDRIAYFIELGETDFLYVSMDAFTDDVGKIGVPTAASGASFQQSVARMQIVSSIEGVAGGAGQKSGNIEFWPNNYSARNAAGIAGASATTYDLGDDPGPPRDGYGCMQVHDTAARRTLFALNNWKAGAKADLGIGNQPTGNPDWTFAANAQTFAKRRLRVLVRCR